MFGPRAYGTLLWIGAAALVATCGGITVLDSNSSANATGNGSTSGSGGSLAQGGTTSGTSSGSGGGIRCESCQAVVQAAAVSNGDIAEASGLAASRRHPNALYLHNDSGDSARVFMMDLLGAHLGTLTLGAGAKAIDWEDIAVGPCPTENGSCIYVGDIGDNSESRHDYQLYVFPEPKQLGDSAVSAFTRYNFNYPDGSHNAETLLVGSSGDVAIVTKVSSGQSRIYRLTLGQGGAVKVTFTGEMSPPLGIAMLTGGDVHPQGDGILLRSYTNLFYYPAIDGDITTTLQGEPCAMQIVAEYQGEAVAWTTEHDGFVTVSEGAHSAIHRYSCAPP